jgi:CRISPR-associated protein Cas2
MIVLVLERVPRSLRGEVTRWLLELQPNVFAGDVTAMVRDKVWEKACAAMNGGAGMLVHSADTEQGFALRFWGKTGRTIVDFNGLSLVRHS